MAHHTGYECGVCGVISYKCVHLRPSPDKRETWQALYRYTDGSTWIPFGPANGSRDGALSVVATWKDSGVHRNIVASGQPMQYGVQRVVCARHSIERVEPDDQASKENTVV